MNATGIYFSCGILVPPADPQKNILQSQMLLNFYPEMYFSGMVFPFQRIENLSYVRPHLSSTITCCLLSEKQVINQTCILPVLKDKRAKKLKLLPDIT